MSATKFHQTLRISCSDISSICGFNPWSNFTNLFEKYLYQDLEYLLTQDANNLELEYISVEDEVISIIGKLEGKEQVRIERIKDKIKNDENLKTSDKTKELLKELNKIMLDPKVNKILTESEKKFLNDELGSSACKGYGVKCENAVLDKYEKVTGYEVVERNEKYLMMGIMEKSEYLISGDQYFQVNDFIEEVEEITVHKNLSPSSPTSCVSTDSKRKIDIIDLTEIDNESITYVKSKKKRYQYNEGTLFYIIGKVDGISYQFDKSSNQDNNKSTKVIIEIKNRVNKLSNPPPIHDQIQLVSYMKLVNDCYLGDLVQSLTGDDNNNNNFLISRINLNGNEFSNT